MFKYLPSKVLIYNSKKTKHNINTTGYKFQKKILWVYSRVFRFFRIFFTSKSIKTLGGKELVFNFKRHIHNEPLYHIYIIHLHTEAFIHVGLINKMVHCDYVSLKSLNKDETRLQNVTKTIVDDLAVQSSMYLFLTRNYYDKEIIRNKI